MSAFIRTEPPKDILTERVLSIITDGYKIRLWVPDGGEQAIEFEDLIERVERDARFNGNCWGSASTAMHIAKSYRVNAVEVLGKHGTGTVCYSDWP